VFSAARTGRGNAKTAALALMLSLLEQFLSDPEVKVATAVFIDAVCQQLP